MGRHSALNGLIMVTAGLGRNYGKPRDEGGKDIDCRTLAHSRVCRRRETHIDDRVRMGHQRLAHAQLHAALRAPLLLALAGEPYYGSSRKSKVPVRNQTRQLGQAASFAVAVHEADAADATDQSKL